MTARFENGTVVSPQRKQAVQSASSDHFQLGKPVYSLKDMVLREEQAQAIEEVLSLARYETRTKDLSTMCLDSIDLLIKEGKLDCPIKGEEMLHCVGVSTGTNFESEELSI